MYQKMVYSGAAIGVDQGQKLRPTSVLRRFITGSKTLIPARLLLLMLVVELVLPPLPVLPPFVVLLLQPVPQVRRRVEHLGQLA